MKEDMRFNAPATTCEELSKIGYTRNGFYLVKGKNATSNSHVELVDCLFANLNGGKEGKDILNTKENLKKVFTYLS